QVFVLRQQLFQAEMELAERRAMIETATNWLASNAPQVIAPVTNVLSKRVEDEYKHTCDLLSGHMKTETDYLLQGMKTNSVFVQTVHKRIEEIQAIKDKMEQEHPQLIRANPTSTSSVADQPVLTQASLFGERAKITQLEIRTNRLHEELDKTLL